jgi:hypothetical protein
MQADEIIQQKEWHELSADEKNIVKELAETEGEYNLLKKMLQVSSAEPTEVPVISAHIKERLSAVVAVKKVSYKRYLYAAAAVIVAVILSTVFIKKGKENETGIVHADTLKKAAVQDLVHVDVAPKDTVIIAPEKRETAPQVVIHKNRSNKKPVYDLRPDNINNDQPVYAVVNKTISQEKDLLDLVSEMY